MSERPDAVGRRPPVDVDTEWMGDAACMGMNPDGFFPERGDSTREAKAVCRTCPVIDRCLDYALANGEKFGVWGGKSERERRRLRKQRIAEGTLARQSTRTQATCGTNAGYQRHRHDGEPACSACTVAHRAYEAQRKAERAS